MKGNATKLKDAISITEYVSGKKDLSPPYLLKSWLSATAWITDPAPKNNSAL